MSPSFPDLSSLENFLICQLPLKATLTLCVVSPFSTTAARSPPCARTQHSHKQATPPVETFPSKSRTCSMIDSRRQATPLVPFRSVLEAIFRCEFLPESQDGKKPSNTTRRRGRPHRIERCPQRSGLLRPSSLTLSFKRRRIFYLFCVSFELPQKTQDADRERGGRLDFCSGSGPPVKRPCSDKPSRVVREVRLSIGYLFLPQTTDSDVLSLGEAERGEFLGAGQERLLEEW